MKKDSWIIKAFLMTFFIALIFSSTSNFLISKYNNTTSPNVQTFLAGIYRKTKIPDAFGPLVAMLIRNSIAQSVGAAHVNNKSANPIYLPPPFDPNEEIGGAILDYLA